MTRPTARISIGVTLAWIGGAFFGGLVWGNHPVEGALPYIAAWVAAFAIASQRAAWLLAGAVLMASGAAITAYTVVGVSLESNTTYFSPFVWLDLAAAAVLLVVWRFERVQHRGSDA